ncbi:MAG: FAD-dependent oxidoreductase, partial [Candidatus Omnitrophota bacterium]|nr:FAD-dependent oxidoreductase [Candidatus Omnitrophota bacterium]
ENGRVTGIKARGSRANEYDELRANVVICAEGANSMLAEKSGLRSGKSKMSRQNRAIGVKEIISLPQELIEDRFNLSAGEGVAIEYFGDAVKNMMGSGFVYTNKNTISVGVGCTIEDAANNRIALYDLLDHFKNHFAIRNLVKGGVVLEYSAHMIPEDSYNNLPNLVTDGLILVGDAAGLANSSLYHEITNLAMASGLYAAETIIEANKIKDFSQKALALYTDKLRDSFVMKDMKQCRNFVSFIHANRQFLTTYPELFCDSIVNYFTVTETPKSQVKRNVLKQAMKKINIVKSAIDVLRAIRNLT